MSLRRTLIVVASALVLTILSACRHKAVSTEKPVAVYVNPDLTLDSFVLPGQKLEWRLDNPQSPTFTFTPQPKLCDPATIQSKATFQQPAGCVVAQQPSLPTGVNFRTYKYTLQLDIAPGAPDPNPVTYTLRVGTCGPC
jgi:hypothetical protein